jgi:hypothetical protein
MPAESPYQTDIAPRGRPIAAYAASSGDAYYLYRMY